MQWNRWKDNWIFFYQADPFLSLAYMNRRHLLKILGAVSTCPALTFSDDTGPRLATDPEGLGFRGERTLMFLDNYPLMNLWHAKIHQSQVEYVPEGDFVDPHIENDGAQTYPMSSLPCFPISD